MGRQLKVNKAVERSQAPQPIVKGDTNSVGDKKGTPKTDRRNLYLANEGLVLNSEEQEVRYHLDIYWIFCDIAGWCTDQHKSVTHFSHTGTEK